MQTSAIQWNEISMKIQFSPTSTKIGTHESKLKSQYNSFFILITCKINDITKKKFWKKISLNKRKTHIYIFDCSLTGSFNPLAKVIGSVVPCNKVWFLVCSYLFTFSRDVVFITISVNIHVPLSFYKNLFSAWNFLLKKSKIGRLVLFLEYKDLNTIKTCIMTHIVQDNYDDPCSNTYGHVFHYLTILYDTI